MPLILISDIKLSDRKKIEKLAKTLYRSETDFCVYGPDGISQIVYRKDKELGEYIYWTAAGGKSHGELQKSEFPLGGEIVDMRWQDGKTVEIEFLYNKKYKNNATVIDVEKGEILYLVINDARPT